MRGEISSQFGFAAPEAAVIRSGRASESWTHTADEVDAWLKTARPGETFLYAHGPQLVQGGAAARVRDLTKKGDVTPHHQRAPDGGFDFIVRRCCRRPRSSAAREPVVSAAMMAVLVAVQEDAQAARRCRSDSEIAAATRLTPDQVKWQLKKLEEAKFISRQTINVSRADPRFRVVTIIATGQSTLTPSGAGSTSACPSNPTGAGR